MLVFYVNLQKNVYNRRNETLRKIHQDCRVINFFTSVKFVAPIKSCHIERQIVLFVSKPYTVRRDHIVG